MLDTNVVSELRLDNPNQHLWQWSVSVSEEAVFISVVTIAEIRSGIAQMPAGRRQQELATWLDQDVRERFRGRILGIDEDVADLCGQLLGRHPLTSGIRRIMDIWLAAIALQHDLTLVTRNQKDFRKLGVKIINPWSEEETS